MNMSEREQKKKLTVGARLAVADDLGLVKIVDSPGRGKWDLTKVVNTWGKADRERAIQFMKHYEGNQLLISRKDGQIEIMNVRSGLLSELVQKGKGRKLDNYASTVAYLPDNQNQNNIIFSGWLDGNIRIHQFKSDNQNEDEQSPKWEMTGVLDAKNKVECMEVCRDNQHIAVGCDGKQLQIWDINSRQNIFLGKGLKPDWLGLVDKAWITCMNWRPCDESNSQIIIGTGIHKVKLYDYKRQKRPVQHMSFGEARVTQVECEQDGNCVWVSNGTGYVYRWDLRKNVQNGGVRGVAGSIRALKINPFKNPNKKVTNDDENYDDDADDSKNQIQTQLASCGLDRWCRIHDVRSRKLLTKVYLKQQLTACAWMPVLKGEEFKQEKENKVDDEEKVVLDSQRPLKKTKIK